jgi:hypothetical protein
MKFPKITHLYKFYGFNTNSLSVLINKRVWFSKPATLNDPFDIDIDFTSPMTRSSFKYMIQVLKRQKGISKERTETLESLEREIPGQNLLNEMNEVITAKFRDDRKDWGVFCMCESYDSILMWSHYADCHRGFCVQFIRNQNNKLSNIEYTRPVSYSYEYPSPNPYKENGTQRIYDELFFTKAKCWEHEKEWRMLNEEGNRELPLVGITDVSAIIFGLNMPEPQKETIINILSDKQDIEYLQATKVSNKFQLEIVKYHKIMAQPTNPPNQRAAGR